MDLKAEVNTLSAQLTEARGAARTAQLTLQTHGEELNAARLRVAQLESEVEHGKKEMARVLVCGRRQVIWCISAVAIGLYVDVLFCNVM